jgi:hypothetical protein
MFSRNINFVEIVQEIVMNVKRLRSVGAIAAGALLLSVVSPTAASAGEKGAGVTVPILADYDMKYCNTPAGIFSNPGPMPNGHLLICENIVFNQTDSRVGTGANIVVGAQVPSCPGVARLSGASVSESRSVGRDESVSWSTTLGVTIMGVFQASATYTEGVTITSSASTGSSVDMAVPSGHLGRMVFTPKMYYGEGWVTMDQWLLDPKTGEKHQVRNGVSQFVKSAIPIARSADLSEGVFHVVSNLMTKGEVYDYCNGDNRDD